MYKKTMHLYFVVKVWQYFKNTEILNYLNKFGVIIPYLLQIIVFTIVRAYIYQLLDLHIEQH